MFGNEPASRRLVSGTIALAGGLDARSDAALARRRRARQPTIVRDGEPPSATGSVDHRVGAEERLRSVRDEIARAAESVGRDPASVTLVAVSKGHDADAIRALYDLGHRDFGESRLQDAAPKIESLAAQGAEDIVWHFIGTLQTNKARAIAARFDAVHSYDDPRQVSRAGEKSVPVLGFIEVDLAEESQKSGVSPEEVDEMVKSVAHCPHVQLRGFMTIGPASAGVEERRAMFRRLREIGERHGTVALSMGMSADFAVAIQEGATHVRVGTALFGAR